jgi:hypothetical protein
MSDGSERGELSGEQPNPEQVQQLAQRARRLAQVVHSLDLTITREAVEQVRNDVKNRLGNFKTALADVGSSNFVGGCPDNSRMLSYIQHATQLYEQMEAWANADPIDKAQGDRFERELLHIAESLGTEIENLSTHVGPPRPAALGANGSVSHPDHLLRRAQERFDRLTEPWLRTLASTIESLSGLVDVAFQIKLDESRCAEWPGLAAAIEDVMGEMRAFIPAPPWLAQLIDEGPTRLNSRILMTPDLWRSHVEESRAFARDSLEQIRLEAIKRADELARLGKSRGPKIVNEARDKWVAKQRERKAPRTWDAIYDELVGIGPAKGWNIPKDSKALSEAYRRRLRRQRAG